MTNAELSETYLVSDLALVSEANFALPLLLPALIWIRLASGRLTGIVTLSKPLSSSAEILSASTPSGRTTRRTKLAFLSRLYSFFAVFLLLLIDLFACLFARGRAAGLELNNRVDYERTVLWDDSNICAL